MKYAQVSAQSVARNNARIRRRIATILFERGPMTRIQVGEALMSEGMFREMPSDSSLTALISKNAQVIQVGVTKVELHNGATVRNMVFDVDRNLIRHEDDLLFTRPFSSMTPNQKRMASLCSVCRQRRIITEGTVCLTCERREV